MDKAMLWRPVNEILDLIASSEQLKILFGSPGWPICYLGMVSRWNDTLEWSVYDQLEDRYYVWESFAPELFILTPIPPKKDIAFSPSAEP